MPIATPNKLTDLNDLKDQFKIEVHKLNYSVFCKNFPYQGDGFWICTCGYFNLHKSNRCLHCNLDKIKLFEISNSDFLSKEKIILKQDKYPSKTISETTNAAETSNHLLFHKCWLGKEIFHSTVYWKYDIFIICYRCNHIEKERIL